MLHARTEIVGRWEMLTRRLRGTGEVIPAFVLRLIMGWEFWESGLEKLHGTNWFTNIQDRFPFPFNIIPVNLSWGIATWFEIAGGIMLWLGLGTRFFAFSLIFLTFVATAAVHWPSMFGMWTDLAKGYAISDMGHGNFKLPLLFTVMLLPLLFNGPGKFSFDYLIARQLKLHPQAPLNDAYAWAIACIVLGVPFLMLLPKFGAVLLLAGVILAAMPRLFRR